MMRRVIYNCGGSDVIGGVKFSNLSTSIAITIHKI